MNAGGDYQSVNIMYKAIPKVGESLSVMSGGSSGDCQKAG
jgi:hypothetical protein